MNSDVYMDGTYANEYVYLVEPTKLQVVSAKTNSIVKTYELDGKCSSIENFITTFHIVCTYEGINFIMELFGLAEDFVLNRYYTNEDIEGLRSVHRIGQGKMIIIGDN